ncbi:hypothetical protein WN944_014763 [Citrus x changshan-huyou]|uniref:Protein yippee-like n=1 Tax=Citrus x changshan-huyou TaxID=2935761 RepID=A0AAP0MAF7_9ROSI
MPTLFGGHTTQYGILPLLVYLRLSEQSNPLKHLVAQTGQAYMFSNAMNVVLGRKEDKQMITGIYTIAKIYCSNCGQELGWHYLRAYDLKQKWKEGNFILEKFKMLKEYK